jgi:signal transduction histidine kinase
MLRDQSDLTKEVLARGYELDQAREAEVAAAATGERLRVARELHDVVAHSLMVMVVQAGAARRNLESGRPGCADALRVVEETGRDSRSELRRLLGLADPAGSPADRSTGIPGMGHLAELVERTRAAGLPVTLTVDGELTSLTDGVDLAAYRIVQEALTNVLRHARATRAWVRVASAADRLDIEVRDDGVATLDRPPQAPGNGITGMQERAGIYSGEVSAGPRPGGGFRVRASIPLQAAHQGQPA